MASYTRKEIDEIEKLVDKHEMDKLKNELFRLQNELDSYHKESNLKGIKETERKIMELKKKIFTKGNKDSTVQVGPWTIHSENNEISVHRGGRAWAQGFKSIQEAKAWIEKKEKYLNKDDDATNKLDLSKQMGQKKGSFEDADPKVAEANKLISLCGGVL